MNPTSNLPGLTFALTLGLGALSLHAVDWPQYRGPFHDGSTTDAIRTNWSVQPPRVLWRRALEPGWSSPMVVGQRLYTQIQRTTAAGKREFCVALSAVTGQELWARDLDRAQYSDLAGYDDAFDGPRSTPSVDGAFVYVLTSYLKLYCLRADTGQQVWRRDFLAEFPGTSVIGWENAGSPLVIGDHLYLNANTSPQRLTAVRKSDGQTVWRQHDYGMTHATPVYAELAGVPQILFLTVNGLVSTDPGSGAELWRHAFTPAPTSTAATPVVFGNGVYSSAAYGKGAWFARVTKNGAAFSVNSTEFKAGSSYMNHWATPVAYQGFQYGIVERSGRSLACLDLTTRNNRWSTPNVGSGTVGFGSVIRADQVLLVLTEAGELVLVQPNPAAYTELGRFPALTRPDTEIQPLCWNHPTVVNGVVYARGSLEITALEVAPPRVPLPPLRLGATLTGTGGLSLRVTGVGAGLPADAAGRLAVERVQELPGVPGGWQRVPATFVVREGGLEAELETSPDAAYFRVLSDGGAQ
jgi:outer membrane protein assembly factor BamB